MSELEHLKQEYEATKANYALLQADWANLKTAAIAKDDALRHTLALLGTHFNMDAELSDAVLVANKVHEALRQQPY